MNNIEKMKTLKEVLRPYQYEALKMCSKYLSDQSQGQALVHLPTREPFIIIMGSIYVIKSKEIIVI